MWVIITSTAPRKFREGQGYFNCPGCGRRQLCTLYQFRPRTYLYGVIPIGTGNPVGPESYHCAGCGREYTADGQHGYDFGEHASPRTWRCFKCKGEVPYERFDCPHCGYRFEISGRL